MQGKTMAVGVLCALGGTVLGGGGFAIADALITSAQIKDGTVQARDIKKGTVSLNRLSPGVQRLIAEGGKPGPTGPQGPAGPQGAKGDAGVAGQDGRGGVNGMNGAAGAAGAAGRDAGARVSSLSADQNVAPPAWAARGLASIDADGAKLGEFTDGEAFGAIRSHALDGVRLRDIALVAYSGRFTGGTENGAAPYFRIFTVGGDAVMFSPNTQAAQRPVAGTDQRWVVTSGSVRYNDDGGDAGDIAWADLIAAHGDERVAFVQVQAGNAGAYSAGSTAHVSNVTFEANGAQQVAASYTFGS